MEVEFASQHNLSRLATYFVFVELYVDDMLLVENKFKEIIKDIKSQLSSQFNMKDIGVVNFNFGHGN